MKVVPNSLIRRIVRLEREVETAWKARGEAVERHDAAEKRLWDAKGEARGLVEDAIKAEREAK